MKCCNYHPKIQASWQCSGCETLFCSTCACVSKEENFPNCTLCRRSLISLSIANQVLPLWKNIPEIAKTPFNSSTVLLLLFFSVIFSILPTQGIASLIFLVMLIPFVDFLFDSMEQMACGEKFKSSLSHYLSLRNKVVLFKLVIVSLLTAFMVNKVFLLSEGVGLLLIALILFVIPSSILILMMEKSMAAMFHPAKILAVINILGRGYLFLYMMISLVVFFTMAFGSYVLKMEQINFFSLFIINFSILFLLLQVFLMAGYLVFQYHNELNFTTGRNVITELSPLEIDEGLTKVEVFIQEARFEDAQTLLLERIKDNTDDYKAHEKLIFLYIVQGKDNYFNQACTVYLEIMANKGKFKYAADFLTKLYSRGTSYSPKLSKKLLEIICEMKNKHQYNAAIFYIESLLELNKMPSDWELLYLLYAQFLAEYTERDGEAKELLNTIVKRTLDQEIATKAEDYLKLIQSTSLN